MTIKTNAFQDAYIERELDLDNCFVKVIEPYAFNNTHSKNVLYIGYNPIDVIRKNTFSGAFIPDIELYDNKLRLLEQGAFSDLTANYLDFCCQELEDDQVLDIETGAFDNVHMIGYEYPYDWDGFYKSQLAFYESDSYCVNCGVTARTLHPGAFRGLGELEELDLSYNFITHIDGSMFNFMPKLVYIDLKDSRIQSIDWLAFIGLRKLEELYLYGDEGLNELWCYPKIVKLIYDGDKTLDDSSYDSDWLDLDECPMDVSQYCLWNGVGTPKTDIIAQADECKEMSTMKELVSYGPTKDFFVGGLGIHTDADHATWGCFRGHSCLDQICGYHDDAMCYKYRKCDGHWTPWGPYSELFLNNPASSCSAS